ncbi:hypothetical protein [Microbacterium sp.]|uniref:hypothetical protein n=1 Tax=Microbacterium sp. TaxID=51671 RepID=UPI003A930810
MNGSTRVRDLRLVPLALLIWGAALLCVFVPQISWWLVGAAGIGGVVALALMRRRTDGVRPQGGLAAVILLGVAAVAMTAGFAVPQRDAATELSGRVIEVVGSGSTCRRRGQARSVHRSRSRCRSASESTRRAGSISGL